MECISSQVHIADLFFKYSTVYICHNNWKRNISPERGPEEINTIGVCSFQDLGDLGEQKCKSRMVKINLKVQVYFQ